MYALSTEPGKLYCIDKRQMRVVRTCGGFKQCTSLDLDSDSLVASWKNGMVKYLDPQTLTTEYTWVCPAPPEMKSVHPVRLSKGAFIYGSSYELLVYTAGKNPRLLGRLPTKEMIISVCLVVTLLTVLSRLVGLQERRSCLWNERRRRSVLAT